MIKNIIAKYANSLYQDVMLRAYQQGRSDVLDSLPPGGRFLDCGSGGGGQYQRIREISDSISPENYVGIEWDAASVLLDSDNTKFKCLVQYFIIGNRSDAILRATS